MEENEWKYATTEQSRDLARRGVALKTEKYLQIGGGLTRKKSDALTYRGTPISVPDVAELGIILGKYTVMKYAHDTLWKLYDDKGTLETWIVGEEIPEAEARAAAALYLLKHGILKAVDLNNILKESGD